MSVVLRNGIYGDYYGSDWDSSNPLTNTQMEVNARYIFSYLVAKGWTVNAIAGILGNMQVESSLNPGRWQNDRVQGDATSHGYSLVQWTPYTKYTEWCSSNGYSDPSEMDTALARIIYEVENNIQWIGVGNFYGISFDEFTHSMMSPYDLGKAFILCYERPADQSAEAQDYRGTLANTWYEYLTGITPVNPGISTKKKNKFKFHLFNRRRQIYG